MPLPDRIVEMLARGVLKVPSEPIDYLDKLPTLGSDVFPDSLRVWDVAASGGEEGQKLHKLLDEAGLTKGQRAGVSHLLYSFTKVEDNDLTLGDIRALTEDELNRLRGRLAWGAKPTISSIKKIKKLFG